MVIESLRSNRWIQGIRRNSIWRLTVIYTVLTTVLVAMVMITVYHLSVGQVLRAQDRIFKEAVLQHELLINQLSSDDYKLQFSPEYQLSNALSLTYQWGNGRDDIVGRLSNIPQRVTPCPSIARFPVYQARYDDIEILTGCVIEAPQGRVLIAQNRQRLNKWQDLFIRASLITLLITVLIGGLSGWWFSRRVVKKVTVFNNTVRQVKSGDMSARIPVSSNGDEFDQMASYINDMLAQLEATFETIRGTTDAIAHDLRTPLNRMRLRVEKVLNQPDDNDKTLQLGLVLEELDGVLATFTSMLELTKLENKILPTSNECYDLKAVIEDVVELIEPLAEEENQTLQCDLVSSSVKGDKNLLFRAIYNLLDNAVKYSGKGSTLSVVLTEHSIVISDSGVGISEDQRDKAFQRLGRLDTSRTHHGYGLGLSIVKAIVEHQGFSIQLKDNLPGLKVVINLTD